MIWQSIREISKFKKIFEDRLSIECHEGVVSITADYKGENDPLNPESKDGKAAWAYLLDCLFADDSIKPVLMPSDKIYSKGIISVTLDYSDDSYSYE